MSDAGFPQVGKLLIVAGLGLAALGVVLFFGEKVGLGRLPGDLSWKGKNSEFHFPVMTSIVVSIVLTILLNLFFSRR